MSQLAPAIVLVHGALTDASIWHGVIANLQQRGHRVLAPAFPLHSLAADAALLRSVLATIDGPIVVVGHSYGGSIISPADALTPHVRGLVFVAAFQQDHDETAGELNYRFPGSGLTPDTTLVRERPGGSGLYLRPEYFAEVYAADVEPAAAAVMAAAQHPIDPSALGETFTGPASWTRLPSWTLIATADGSVPTEAQRFMAQRAGSTVIEIDSSHAVPVAHPAETADLIAAAARAVSAEAGPTMERQPIP
ncbi:MAG: alpha/beta hydrolase [Pseudonocardiales bacterium]|nr:alpha/beta hydrolase [Pseudonocardiales bacterium]